MHNRKTDRTNNDLYDIAKSNDYGSQRHARAAGRELAKLVKGLAPVRITFRTAAKEVNAASMLALLSLGLKCGTEIEICAEGGDEAAAVKAVAAFIANMSE